MPISSAISLWFLFLSASFVSNTTLFMVIFITTKWNAMSRKFSLGSDQRKEIIKRLIKKGLTKYGNEAEMCRDYDLAPGTFMHWKQEGKISLSFILEFCADYGISLDWILRGIEPEDLPKSRLKSQP